MAASARVGDAVIVSGTLGDNGMAIMSVRDGLTVESPIISDSAPLHGRSIPAPRHEQDGER